MSLVVTRDSLEVSSRVSPMFPPGSLPRFQRVRTWYVPTERSSRWRHAVNKMVMPQFPAVRPLRGRNRRSDAQSTSYISHRLRLALFIHSDVIWRSRCIVSFRVTISWSHSTTTIIPNNELSRINPQNFENKRIRHELMATTHRISPSGVRNSHDGFSETRVESISRPVVCSRRSDHRSRISSLSFEVPRAEGVYSSRSLVSFLEFVNSGLVTSPRCALT